MDAIVLSIGDELVLGQTVDTNTAWLARQLASVGIAVSLHLTIADDQQAIEKAIAYAIDRADLVLITGGLGPTEDDLTRQALAAVLNTPLELNPDCLTRLEAFFRDRGRPMPPSNRVQAMIPRGARPIDNTAGTAPGIHATATRPGNRQPADIFVMPGVPKEMTIMFQRDILSILRDRSNGGVILSRTLHTFGLGESNVAELLGDLMDRRRNPSVGTTVSGGIVSLRINARSTSWQTAERELAATEQACRDALGDLIYGADGCTLPEVVGQLLRSRSHTVATAESCTGGLLAKYLTDIPGSSDYFRYGWVTYSNQAKTALLDVPPKTLQQHGAVSEPTVLAMATSARIRSNADFALSVSGIAGPTGGLPHKPVGTVCIALADRDSVTARTFIFSGDREMIRDRSAKMALTLLRYRLIQSKLPF